MIGPLAKALGPGGRLIAIHSHGHDPGMEIIRRVWPDDNPFIHDRHQILKAVKHELGAAGRDLNFNAYADNRSLFRYDMHTLPSEISESIGTSTLFAAWNAAIYVAQVEDDRLGEVVADGRYIDATRAVLRERGGLVVLRRILRDLAPARVSHEHGRARTRTGRKSQPRGAAHRGLHAKFFRRGDAAVGCRYRGARRAAARHARLYQRRAAPGGGRIRSAPRSGCARPGSSRCPTSRCAISPASTRSMIFWRA